MYDFHNSNSLNKIKFEILPILNTAEKIYSVIVVGNKIDLLDINTQKFVIEQDKTEIEKYQEDMTMNLKYFYISCKNYSGISPLFSEILNSLVNPSHIFYTQKNEEIIFNEKFEKALKRIFRIFDKDRKGIITKNEFNKIHESIFDIKLESDHFVAIKECIKIINSVSNNNSKGTGISSEDEISSEGFISLNKLAVQVGESQTTWSTLRKFGYNDDLELDNWYFKSKKYAKLDLNEYVVELSNYSKHLLTDLFLQFKISNINSGDKSKGENIYITEKEWNDIFFPLTCNLNEDFSFDKIVRVTSVKNNTEKNDKYISLDDWVFIWSCFTRINNEEAFKTFLYLGFDIDFEQFVKKTKKSEINLFRELDQNTIYICFIAQNQENINNFMKYFINYYSLVEAAPNKQRDIIVKAGSYSIILSNYLVNELEVSISNITTSTVNSFRKYDLLIFSDDVINSKVFSYVSFKTPFFVFYTDPCLVSNNADDKSILVVDERISQAAIVNKIISFAKEPINYLRVSERKEVIRVRRRNNILISFKFFLFGMAGIAAYYIGVRKYNLFK